MLSWQKNIINIVTAQSYIFTALQLKAAFLIEGTTHRSQQIGSREALQHKARCKARPFQELYAPDPSSPIVPLRATGADFDWFYR